MSSPPLSAEVVAGLLASAIFIAAYGYFVVGRRMAKHPMSNRRAFVMLVLFPIFFTAWMYFWERRCALEHPLMLALIAAGLQLCWMLPAHIRSRLGAEAPTPIP